MTTSYDKVRDADELAKHDFSDAFEDIARQKISALLQCYLEREVDELIQRARYTRHVGDAAPIHRDGYENERIITTGHGPIRIRRPRVRGAKHGSQILPKYRRRTKSVDTTLHQLWIEGLADRDFERSLRGLLGADAPLSASTISRVNAEFLHEYDTWCKRPLNDREYVYIWVDGVHLGVGPNDERRVILTIIGADQSGVKHLIALYDAMSESEESWTELLVDLRARGFKLPKLFIADGAHGFWNAATRVYPDAGQQRCLLHKMRNVLDKVPEHKRAAVHAKFREIMNAEDEKKSRRRVESLALSLQRDYPKAATCLRDDLDRQMAFYKFPKENWKSIRTTNPIESIFASVRLRTDAMKRLRSGKSATYLLYALITRIAKGWNRISGHRVIKNMLARDLALPEAA